jgi:cell division transport system permease protein
MAENNIRTAPTLTSKFLYWLKLHGQNCRQALKDMARQPVSSTLTIAVIGIALALPATLNVLVQNGRNLAGGWEGMRDFSIYLAADQELEVAQNLAGELRQIEQIDSVSVTTADDALEEFRVASGLDNVIDTLTDNPLPHTLVVRPIESATPDYLVSLTEELVERSEVDLVKLDMQWVQRLNAILDFLRRAMTIAAGMLIAAVIIIIGNTIRLDIQNRSDEIEILKLLGASDGFVRRPFLYVGLWYGILGSLVALLLLIIGGAVLAEPLQRLIGLYESQLELLGLDRDTILAIIGGGILAGWGGAWTAVSRHLSKIQPH